MKKIFCLIILASLMLCSGAFAAEDKQAASDKKEAVIDPANDTRTNVEKLTDENPMVRRNAVIYIGSERKKENVPALVPMIDDASVEVQRAAIDALAKTGDTERVAPVLTGKFSREKNYAVKQNIIVALGDLQARSALPLIKAQLKDPFPGMRNEALRALGKINDKQTYGDIVAMLKDESEGTRMMAADVVGKLQLAAGAEQLRKNLKDPVSLVRRSSARALGQLKASSALADLQLLLKDTDVGVAAAAKQSIEEIKGKTKTKAK